MKNIKVVARTTALSSLLTLAGAGAAFADTGTISTTGPDSTNVISSHQTTTVTQVNVNSVSVSNTNVQLGVSGDAEVAHNTSAGSASSGNVTNANSTVTTVMVNNDAPSAVGGSGSGSGDSNGSGSGAGSGGVGGQGSASSMDSTSSQGVGGSGAGVGGGVLPEVGCSIVCDVSALRNQPAKASAVDSALNQAQGISAALLALAAALSLIGAGGSAVYAARRAKA